MLRTRFIHVTVVTAFCVTGVVTCRADAFEPLAPGAVRPTGWMRDWCETARDGYIGHLDDVDRHFQIAWTTNCMRRGEFLSWQNSHQGSWSAEGGAYWFDGLVRLAWQLDDPQLKAYAKARLDTVLDRMNPNAITFVHWMDRRDPAQMRKSARATRPGSAGRRRFLDAPSRHTIGRPAIRAPCARSTGRSTT